MSGGTIEIADLVVRYGAVPAVNGISFTVEQGEHVTLLGPSGCGKTTTLRAVAGLEERWEAASVLTAKRFSPRPNDATCRRKDAASRWYSSPMRCGRI
jgi:ABC-type sulfate/molybdate transport systems ATPase subunit